MPGVDSLRAREYYAHPRNAFWSIMGELCGAAPSLAYAARSRRLNRAGIAVWDVVAECRRRGSLDADIERTSIVVNDFVEFFSRRAKITHVFFNGSTAEGLFFRLVRATLANHELVYQRLPSTSPANASLTRAQKITAWRAHLRSEILYVN